MSALDAFGDGAGISAIVLNLLLRIGLLSGFLIWAAWCVLKLMKYHSKHGSENVAELISDYVHLFFLVAVMAALVFI